MAGVWMYESMGVVLDGRFRVDIYTLFSLQPLFLFAFLVVSYFLSLRQCHLLLLNSSQMHNLQFSKVQNIYTGHLVFRL